MILSITAWFYLRLGNFISIFLRRLYWIEFPRPSLLSTISLWKVSTKLILWYWTKLTHSSPWIFIWQCRMNHPITFFAYFCSCILLQGYWTKIACAILLPLASNWLERSDWGIAKVPLIALPPLNGPPTNSASIPTTIIMVTSLMEFFFCHIFLWLYGLLVFSNSNKCCTSSFVTSSVIMYRPIFMIIVALLYIYVLGLHQLWLFFWIVEVM